jgi:hypothetical protein
MEDQALNNFLDVYHEVMFYGAIGFLGLALLNYIIHVISLSTKSDPKQKYDFLREKEIRSLKLSFYFIAITVFMVVNMYMKGVEFDVIWFSVRLFIGIAIGTMFGYVANLILKYYYPAKLDKKLKKWRFTPRINQKTGNRMRLLSEDEEDVHLDEGMQAEEEAFSVDYDVWIDEETGDVKIEKYPGHLQAVECGNCGFYTMRVIREEITKDPTDSEEGELIKHYECGYCGSIRATQFNIAKKSVDVQHLDPSTVKYADKRLVASVEVEIIANDGHKRNYTFQSIDHATAFLSEFDYEKLPQ